MNITYDFLHKNKFKVYGIPLLISSTYEVHNQRAFKRGTRVLNPTPVKECYPSALLFSVGSNF